MPTTRSFAALAAVSIALLAAGFAIAYGTSARSMVTEYRVFVEAEDGTDWTLWIPWADPPLPVAGATDRVRVEGPVATNRGMMMNLTGRGTAAVNFTLARTAYSVGGFVDEGRVNLSAGDGQGAYWVHRQTTDPAARVRVSGRASWTGERLGERFRCGGLIAWFQGDAAEGWTLVPRQWTDCIGTIQPPVWDAAAAVLLGVGGALSVGLAWIRIESRRRA